MQTVTSVAYPFLQARFPLLRCLGVPGEVPRHAGAVWMTCAFHFTPSASKPPGRCSGHLARARGGQLRLQQRMDLAIRLAELSSLSHPGLRSQRLAELTEGRRD